MAYVEFNQTISGSELKDMDKSFMKDLENLSSHDQNCKLLLSIIRLYKYNKTNFRESLNVKYFRSSDLDGVILIIISGNSDKLLNRLASECQFPRGFPIIYIPNKSIHMYGFYPKFENDDRQDVIENSDEFKDIAYLTFNYKYSGFLGQLIPFKYNDTYYYTTCAKNSTGNKFSKEIHRIIKDKCTQEVIEDLVEKNLHICGETMSKYDQVHGSKVLQDSFIVTMIAVGHCVNFSYVTKDTNVDQDASANAEEDGFFSFGLDNEVLSSDEDVSSELEVVSIYGHTYSESEKSLIKFLNGVEVLEKSLEYSFSVDNIFTINDKSILFLQTLSKDRNYLNLTRFQQIIDDLGSVVEVKSGNFDHASALGDVLEGIIIKILYNNGNKKTLKLKFPYYTIRTMFLRNTFFKLNDESSKVNLNYINSLAEVITNNPCGGSAYKDAIARFKDQWVINDGVGKLYYDLVCNLLCENLQAWCADYINLYTSFIQSDEVNGLLYSEGSSANEIGYPFYAFHIYVIDRVFNELFPSVNTFEKAREVLQQRNMDVPVILSSVKASTPVNIIFVFGAIGTGKSTFGNKLQKLIGDGSVHIDGDILDLEVSENVYALGEERNPYTIWKMIEAMLLNGKLPIITTGGGVFSDYKIFKEFGTMLKNVNLNFNISAYISSNLREIIHYNNSDEFSPVLDNYVRNLYFDDDRLLKCVLYRNWASSKTDPKFKAIKGNNERNFNIVKDLLRDYKVNDLYLFPAINSPDEMDTVVFDSSNVSVSNNNNEIMKYASLATFGQKRVLVSYNYREQDGSYKLKFHHITAFYDPAKNIHYAGEQIFNQTIDGVYYKLYSDRTNPDNGSIELIVLDNELLNEIEPDLNSKAHITVSAKPHAPSSMKDIAIAIKTRVPFENLSYKLNTKPVTTKSRKYNTNPISDGSIDEHIDVKIWNVFYITF
jgi:shikimate kinase